MNTSVKHLPAKERRAATVEAFVELAGEQDPGRITTAAIAKRMGLTQGALFRHFPNKAAILEAVMEWVAERLISRIEKAAEAESSPFAALESTFMAHIDFIAEHPGIPHLLFSELKCAEETIPKRIVKTIIRRYEKHLKHLFEQGKTCGEFDGELDADAAATLFIGTVQGLVIQSLLSGDMKRIYQDAPRVFVIYRRGVGRRE